MGESAAGLEDRRSRIREAVLAGGWARIDDLAAELGVSAMTIHRDLDVLQSQGWLRKVRGGATATPSSVYHGDVRHRRASMAEVKQRLARAALAHVQPGSAVMIDESTTGLAFAEVLHERAPVTVISHFLTLVNQLAGQPGIDVIGLGGLYYQAYDAFLGVRTIDAISTLHADVLVSSTTSVTRGHCYHQSQETVAVKRVLMEAADVRVLLVDHTKFAKRGLYRLAPLTAFDHVLVDDGVPAEEVERMVNDGVPVRVVAADGTVVDPAATRSGRRAGGRPPTR